jgi:CHAD domain-containing protein
MPTAGDLLRQRLANQREALGVAEAAVRNGEPQGLHDLRVAMRRIRSALATFRPILDRSVTEPLREELKWASGRLGQARDADVATDHTDQLIDDADLAGLEEEAVSGLRARLRIDAAASADVVDETLDSQRYVATTSLLDELVLHPPLTDKAEREARKVARKRVRHEIRRLKKRVAGARMPIDASDPEAPHDPDEHVTRLHGVRKAAKRLRYAAETAGPVTGKRVRRTGKHAKRIQSVLGDHHDAVITRSTLRHLALDEASGEAAAFLLGHLDADEQRATRKLEDRAWREIEAIEDVASDQ